jgi:hypothetical protein
MRITIVPDNEDEMHTWEEQGPLLLDNIKRDIAPSAQYVKFRLEESEFGIGASWPSIILEIVEIGGLVFIGIPALHKKVRETLSEWKEINKNIDKFVSWLSNKKTISTKSIEVAYLAALTHLDAKTDVNELELLEAQEIIGHSGFITPKFENTQTIYYSFKFRKGDEKLYAIILDGYLNIHNYVELYLDPFQKFVDEANNDI